MNFFLIKQRGLFFYSDCSSNHIETCITFRNLSKANLLNQSLFVLLFNHIYLYLIYCLVIECTHVDDCLYNVSNWYLMCLWFLFAFAALWLYNPDSKSYSLFLSVMWTLQTGLVIHDCMSHKKICLPQKFLLLFKQIALQYLVKLV